MIPRITVPDDMDKLTVTEALITYAIKDGELKCRAVELARLLTLPRETQEDAPDLDALVNERDPYPVNRLDGLTVHHVGATKVHHATGVRCKLCPKDTAHTS